MQPLEGLVDHFNVSLPGVPFGGDEGCDLAADLVERRGGVDLRKRSGLPAFFFFEELGCRLEGDEAAKLAHIDPIAIRVADGRRRTDKDDFLRIEADQLGNKSLFQRHAAHDRVVDHDDRIGRPDYVLRHFVELRHR